jgi:hypothetical protein
VNADPQRLEVLEAPELVQLLLEVFTPRQRLREVRRKVSRSSGWRSRKPERKRLLPKRRTSASMTFGFSYRSA